MNTNLSLSEKIGAKTPQDSYSSIKVAKAVYNFANDGGAIGLITPKRTITIPDNAIIIGATLNSTTACTSSGAGTLAVGTSAGSSATSIKTATAVASLSADAVVNGTVTLAAPVKMTAAGSVTVTVASFAFTAGVVEVSVYYVVAGA